mgnify:CR=1 FL=1
MVIDFSSIDFREKPVLVLRNLDGTPLQTLGYAYNLSADICYNEISTITFDLPERVNGAKTPHYDDVIGTRIVDMVGWGQFVLADPSEEKDGVKTIKSCKAYSLEYELTYKKMSLEENTYNFWNPVAPDETVIGIILSYLPSWSVGSIDPTLVGKYRTFSESNVNIYNFIKSTVQDKYSCICDFDTYNRRINVRATASGAVMEPVYLSLENLAKKITLEEDTENIYTVLDVNGADGVTIRSVNPMGTNKIYDLSYFMNTGHFSQAMIDKWNAWKQAYIDAQVPYYNMSVEMMLKTMEILNLENKIKETLGVELSVLQNQRAVKAEYLASISKGSSQYPQTKSDLATINAQIVAKQSEIASAHTQLTNLQTEKDALTAELAAINDDLAFSSFFTNDELIILDRYCKEDAIEDSSFVYQTTEAYIDDDKSASVTSKTLSISSSIITSIDGFTDRDVYTARGGTMSIGNIVSADIISASMERKSSDGAFIFTAYLASGTVGEMTFKSGCISLSGNCETISETTSGLSFMIASAHMYVTKNVTAYQEHEVEWDLYNYGKECLEKLCHPSYTFNVTAANFFSLNEFTSFANEVELGQKIYLDVDNGTVLNPILVKVGIDFENPASLSLQFGDKYNLSDSSFSLADLLERSISMGKTVDISRFGYNAFIESGASSAVKEYMMGALDASKQTVLSGSNIAISFDGSGFHARKFDGSGVGYDPEEIAIINNNIVFTKDGWTTAEMAIGHFHDANLGDSWGIVAPSIVGTLLAGENLVIEAKDPDNNNVLFKVDGSGALLHNARFDIENQNGHIVLDPELGLGVGQYPIIKTENGQEVWDEDKANFWVDMSDGSVHLRGTLEGCDGTFSGSLSAATGSFSGEITGGSIKIGGTSASPNFYVDSNGNLTAKSGTFSGTIYGNKLVDSNGNDMMDNGKFDPDYLNLKGLTVRNTANETTFAVDSNGNVTVNGNVQLEPGSTISWANITGKPDIDALQDNVGALQDDVEDALDAADNAETIAKQIADGTYANGTFINGTTIYSPEIVSNEFDILPQNATTSGSFNIYGYFDDTLRKMLSIQYSDMGAAPVTTVSAWGNIAFTGGLDFSSASVTGLSITATFG